MAAAAAAEETGQNQLNRPVRPGPVARRLVLNQSNDIDDNACVSAGPARPQVLGPAGGHPRVLGRGQLGSHLEQRMQCK